jgi:hypothetical protein
MHTILYVHPQKVALIAVLPLYSKSLHNSSAQLFLAKLPYPKIVATHCSFKKKTTTTIEDP